MKRRAPKPQTSSHSAPHDYSANHCRAIVLVDGAGIRKKIKKDYEKALRDIDNSRRQLDRFHQTDLPQFTRWRLGRGASGAQHRSEVHRSPRGRGGFDTKACDFSWVGLSSISRDGSVIAFHTDSINVVPGIGANNPGHVYVRDLGSTVVTNGSLTIQDRKSTRLNSSHLG